MKWKFDKVKGEHVAVGICGTYRIKGFGKEFRLTQECGDQEIFTKRLRTLKQIAELLENDEQ